MTDAKFDRMIQVCGKNWFDYDSGECKDPNQNLLPLEQCSKYKYCPNMVESPKYLPLCFGKMNLPFYGITVKKCNKCDYLSRCYNLSIYGEDKEYVKGEK